MNKVRCYCVFDRKSAVYNTPYFLINDQVAIRQFSVIANDKESMVYKYPEDFCLYYVGDFDMMKGEITPVTPTDICQGLAVRKEVKEL